MIDNNFDSVQFDRKRILDVVRSEKITSINQLARRLNRNVKNVHQDLKLLYAYGFVNLKKEGRKVALTVPYNTRLKIEIPIGKTDASLDRALRTFSLCLRNLSSLLTSSPP